MADKTAPLNKYLVNHLAVRMKHCIVAISSSSSSFVPASKSEFWTYNLWTEHWTKFLISNRERFPHFTGECGVAIGSVIYFCGGSLLWKLSRSTDDKFHWSRIHFKDCSEMPSPRSGHCGWQYIDKMWIFGGRGGSPFGYINGHGTFEGPTPMVKQNNQLLSYDPSIETWEVVACYGDTPSPRRWAAAALSNDQVWMLGGYDFFNNRLDDIFNLNMLSFVWTKIGNDIYRPRLDPFSQTLTPITTNQLVLHSYGSSTWIFDVQSNMWREHQGSNAWFSCHTSTTGLNKDVIILGHSTYEPYNPVLYVRLEPKSLQQLAMKLLFEHRTALPWKSLPPQLKHKLTGTWE